jgi:hypothetical protein
MDYESSRVDGPHALLQRLVGTHTGRARLWFEPGDPRDDEPATGTVTPLQGGRFVRLEYSTRIGGEDQTGSAVVGCGLDRSLWQIAWIDTFHTGLAIMFLEGPCEPGATKVDARTTYSVGEGPAWGWRTTLEPTGDGIVVQHFNVTPDGDEMLAVDMGFTRVGDACRST